MKGKEVIMNIFRNKVAIITGGASGIGKGLCKELGKEGAIVIIADIQDKKATEVADEINNNGGRARGVLLDVTRQDDVQNLIEETFSEYGRIDYIFNNAGVCVFGLAEYHNVEHLKKQIDVNLLGVIYGTLAAYKIMIKQGFGHIINTSSGAGLVPFAPEIGYTTTKHAVLGLTMALRCEAEDYGVKVSAICPTFVKTEIFQSALIINVDPSDREKVISSMAMKPLGVDKAVKIIIRGVTRNQARIIVGSDLKFIWLLFRINPIFIKPLQKAFIRLIRKYSKTP
jgi:NAD(P)-dependent dehydrogenase (short-subunit alcohol dehydrogenase family)